MSNWPGVVELCSTRFNWEGVYIWPQSIWTLPHVKLTWYNSALYHYLMSSWPKHKANASMTWPHAALGHQMSLLGGTSCTNCVSNAFSIAFSRMSRWPYVVLLLATRCLYWGSQLIWGYTSSYDMNKSRWPYMVLLLATRCLYWGLGVSSSDGYRSSEKMT